MQYSKTRKIAWPTIIYAIFFISLWWISLLSGVSNNFPVLLVITVNSLACYFLYIALHDATHNAVFLKRSHNEILGAFIVPYISQYASFKMYRYIHMQHHIHANHVDKDPDIWATSKRKWILPIKWFFLEFGYFLFYIKRIKGRPKKELVEWMLTLMLTWSIFGLIAKAGYMQEALLFWILPSRIAMVFLVWVLDYLPHTPYEFTQEDNVYKATNIRLGLEWLLTPLMLFQNFHLIHHLYPTEPFYKMKRIWNAESNKLLKKELKLVDPLGKRLLRQDI